MPDDVLANFMADEGPAIKQLRRLVGGEMAKRLDASPDSLGLLDTFVANLTARPRWEESELFTGLGDMRTWLALRVAYYMGRYARRQYGCEWYLAVDAGSPVRGTPVLAVNGIEFSPLEVAMALLDGGVEGGLVGFFADLEVERRKARSLE